MTASTDKDLHFRKCYSKIWILYLFIQPQGFMRGKGGECTSLSMSLATGHNYYGTSVMHRTQDLVHVIEIFRDLMDLFMDPSLN